VAAKLKALIAPETVEELESKVESIRKMKDDLEQSALQDVETWVTEMVGPYTETLKQIEDAKNLATDIARVVNLVQWGARALACASPPAWGCLWLVAEQLLLLAADELMQTCWFQKKITPLVAGVSFIKDTLPAELAELIIKGIRKVLPEGLHDVFADVNKGAVEATADDIDCDALEESGHELTAERQAMMDMIEAIGQDRFEAFSRLSRKYGIRAEEPLTVEQINRAKQAILDSGLSAAEMELYAGEFPQVKPDVKAKAVPLEQFLDVVKKSVAPPVAGGGITDFSQQPKAGAGGKSAEGGGSGEGEGEGEGEGGGGGASVRVKPAGAGRSLPSSGVSPATVSEGVGRSDYKGTPVTVTLSVSVGDSVVYLEDVKATVSKRVFKPSVENAHTLIYQVTVTESKFFDLTSYYKSGVLPVSWLEPKAGTVFQGELSLASGGRQPPSAAAPAVSKPNP
jgi:uncharacterized membrane protein YgcG